LPPDYQGFIINHHHHNHLLDGHAGHGAGEPVQLHHQLLPVEGHRGRPRDHPGAKKNLKDM